MNIQAKETGGGEEEEEQDEKRMKNSGVSPAGARRSSQSFVSIRTRFLVKERRRRHIIDNDRNVVKLFTICYCMHH